MLLVLEIAMLIGGIYAIVTRKVPGILIGGGKYQVAESTAQIFGIMWVLPLPVAFAGGIILSLLFGEAGVGYTGLLELVAVYGIALLSVVMLRITGKPSLPANDLEATIATKANGALMYAILSFTGFATLFVAPLAWMYANQVLKLIDQHQTGQQYLSKAKTARALAAIATVLVLVAVICLLTLALTSS